MDSVESQPQQSQVGINQDSSQPVSQQPAVETTPQQPLEPTPIPKKRKWLLLTLVIFVVLLLGVVGAMIFVNNSSRKELTVREGLRIAESIDPYVPEGYSILHKAKLVEFPSGGVLFETQLVSGENKIDIILLPRNSLECKHDTKQIGNKTACVIDTVSLKIIMWIDGNVTYQVLTGSPGVTLDDLNKIVESL